MFKTKQFVVAMMNTKTGEREAKIQGLVIDETGEKKAWANFHISINVHMTHRNRLAWKKSDCKYSYTEATDDNIEKAFAWASRLSVEEYRKQVEADKNESWMF